MENRVEDELRALLEVDDALHASLGTAIDAFRDLFPTSSDRVRQETNTIRGQIDLHAAALHVSDSTSTSANKMFERCVLLDDVHNLVLAHELLWKTFSTAALILFRWMDMERCDAAGSLIKVAELYAEQGATRQRTIEYVLLLLEIMLCEANAAMKTLVHPDALVTLSIANMCSKPVVVDAVSICFVHNGRLLESTIELHEVLGVSDTSSLHLGVHLGNLASRPSTRRCSRTLEPFEALPDVTWHMDGGHCIAGLSLTSFLSNRHMIFGFASTDRTQVT
ncbi:hypothetical protein SPRG_22113 [Saprolegnia parasitica CBS 223.65]|uniref:Uncharacterized protein n=1 Tax=Saprolegnia parasitica (strain CBS 223.65) TaxID=695850 RepID=A0A067D0A1_SAPPC|nr:hypothetical protein SPRG_22113 [Saprolegnia parasitica CBS 223.65]KDO32482.1 hypothetical protein SPRG_22113 [Saprolegnia parasitica CBS 223.65]|eukprot:XP_012197072.1 hypothetical protein SPRG_22113 [Saprolegnia parasitica CBS 223.65]